MPVYLIETWRQGDARPAVKSDTFETDQQLTVNAFFDFYSDPSMLKLYAYVGDIRAFGLERHRPMEPVVYSDHDDED